MQSLRLIDEQAQMLRHGFQLTQLGIHQDVLQNLTPPRQEDGTHLPDELVAVGRRLDNALCGLGECQHVRE